MSRPSLQPKAASLALQLKAASFVSSANTVSKSQPAQAGAIRHSTLQRAIQGALLSIGAALLLPVQAQNAPAATTSKTSASTSADTTTTTSALPEIQVKARQDKQRAGTRTTVTSEDMARRNVNDMAGIARYEPLISVPSAASGSGNVWDGAGNTGYNIRGIEGNRVSLDVDGIAIPDAAPKPDGTTLNGFGTGREYFDPETFREVRIGSGTSATGTATPGLGGGVAFVTKSPQDYLGTGSDGPDSYLGYKLGYSSVNRSYAHTLTGAARFGDLQALAVAVHRKGHEGSSKGDIALNPDDWHSDALLGKFLWTLSATQKFDVTIDAYDRNNKRLFNNKQGASYPEGASQNSTTKRTRVSLTHQLSAPTALFDTLNTRFYWQDAKIEDVTDARYITGAKPYLRHISTGYYNKSTGFSSDASKQIADVHTLTYGISADQTETRRPWLEDRTVIATDAHQITMKNRMADMDTKKLTAYLRDDISLDLGAYKATLTPGLRAEYRRITPKNLASYLIAVPTASKEIREESESYLTPSLALTVALSPQLDVYGQYNRGTRLPTAAERTGTYDSFSYTGAGNGYAVLGNPKLKKETSDAFELGLKGAPAKGISFRSALFYTQYKNFIEYASQPADPVNYPTISFGLYRPENLGKVRTWGGEVSGRVELGVLSPAMNAYYLDAAAGLSRGRAENTVTGKSDELVSAAPYKTSITFGYEDPSQVFGFALTGTHAGSKQATNDVISGSTTPRFTVPAYTLFDLSVHWTISKNAKLNFGIYNIGDRKYWDYASSRGLEAPGSATSRADIERQAMPGRNAAVSLSVNY